MLKKLIPAVFHCPYRHRGFPMGLLLGVDSSTAEPLAVRRSRGATGQLQGSQINGSYSTNLELFQYPSFCPNWRSSWVWAFPLTLPTVGTQPVLATPHSEVLLTHHTNTLSIFQSDCAPSWVLFALPRMPSLPTLHGKHIFSRMSQLFTYKDVASECFDCAIMIESFICPGNYWSGFLFQWTVRPSVLGLCSYFLVPEHTHGRDTIRVCWMSEWKVLVKKCKAK